MLVTIEASIQMGDASDIRREDLDLSCRTRYSSLLLNMKGSGCSLELSINHHLNTRPFQTTTSVSPRLALNKIELLHYYSNL